MPAKDSGARQRRRPPLPRGAHPVEGIETETPLTTAVVVAYKAVSASSAAALAPLDLYPGNERAILLLWAEGELPQGEIARRLGVEQPTATKALQRLERAGIVRRERDPNDNRQVIVSLTEAGKAACAPAKRARLALEQQIADGLSERERAQLIRLLERVTDRLREA
jgi:MarR family transcriptional regulator, organic hydroperoxide resistance regulator